jgi:hypothetical protein
MGNRREEKKKAIPHLAAENSSIKTSSITSKEVMSLWKIKTDGEERHERNRIRRKRRKKETAPPHSTLSYTCVISRHPVSRSRTLCLIVSQSQVQSSKRSVMSFAWLGISSVGQRRDIKSRVPLFIPDSRLSQ